MGMDFSEMLKGTEMDKTKEAKEKIKEISFDEFMQRMAKVIHEKVMKNEDNSMGILYDVFTISITSDFIIELSQLLFGSHIDLNDIPKSKDIKVKFEIRDFLAASSVLFEAKTSRTNKIIKEVPETIELFALLILSFVSDLYLEEE